MSVRVELSKRYAKAIFEASRETGRLDRVLAELRSIAAILGSSEIGQVFSGPYISAREKKEILLAGLKGVSLEENVNGLLHILGDRNKLSMIPHIVEAFQSKVDELNSVARGEVRSAAILPLEQRKDLEERVSRVIGKRVVLEYKEDLSLVGGLVATVGSLSFDDSIVTHLKSLNEDLTRRVN